MRGTIFVIALIAVYLLLAPTILAQTPTTDPAAGGPVETCDLCGKCGEQQPPDWEKCNSCLTNPSHIDAEGNLTYTWTVIGCLPTSPGGFTQAALKVLTSIVGGISFLALLYGGGMMLTSSGRPERIEAGKSILISAIGGLLLVVFAVFILKFIGLEILSLPGFGG
jgi:hypothetical protein